MPSPISVIFIVAPEAACRQKSNFGQRALSLRDLSYMGGQIGADKPASSARSHNNNDR